MHEKEQPMYKITLPTDSHQNNTTVPSYFVCSLNQKKKTIIAFTVGLLVCALVTLSGCSPLKTLENGTSASNEASSQQAESNEMTQNEKTVLAVTEKVSSMSLKEKICQMVVAYPEDVSESELSFTAEGIANLADYPFGGICYFPANIDDPDVLRSNIKAAQAAAVKSGAGIPLFISTDEEGGGLTYPDAAPEAGGSTGVARLAEAELPGTEQLYPMFYYREQGEDMAYDNARMIAKYLADYGFNWDYAPVADTNSNVDNPVIGYRAYSDDFGICSVLVSSAVRGYESENIATSLKHFPGHGDTETDTHEVDTYVDKDYYQMKSQELVPFMAGIAAGADSVMMGHIIVPAVDDVPASMSSEWIETILRGEMGFDGVVLTDGLKMGAMSDRYTNSETAIGCILAGNDILLLPEDPYGAVDALMGAVESGEIPEERIDASVTRILKMKASHGIWLPDVA